MTQKPCCAIALWLRQGTVADCSDGQRMSAAAAADAANASGAALCVTRSRTAAIECRRAGRALRGPWVLRRFRRLLCFAALRRRLVSPESVHVPRTQGRSEPAALSHRLRYCKALHASTARRRGRLYCQGLPRPSLHLSAGRWRESHGPALGRIAPNAPCRAVLAPPCEGPSPPRPCPRPCSVGETQPSGETARTRTACAWETRHVSCRARCAAHAPTESVSSPLARAWRRRVRGRCR